METKQEMATGREVEQVKQTENIQETTKKLLESNRINAHTEVMEVLKKYDCKVVASITVTEKGNFPQISIINNEINR